MERFPCISRNIDFRLFRSHLSNLENDDQNQKKKKKNEFDLSAKNMSLSAQLRGAFLESGLQVEDQNQATSFSAEK